MNTEDNLDTALDTLRAMRLKARKVVSRHPAAKARRRGAGGSVSAPPSDSNIDPLPSQNLQQKEVPQSLATTEQLNEVQVNPPPVSITEITLEQTWRNAGEFDATVYCRPLNERLLLIRLDDGKNARVIMHKELRLRFSAGARIWIKPTQKPGLYELAGRYTQWGKRVG